MVIYQVFHSEEWVGDFLQASFSTREKAQAYVDKQEPEFKSECWIRTYMVDSE